MDIKDTRPDLTPPEIMTPGLAASPLQSELVIREEDQLPAPSSTDETQQQKSPTPLQDSLRRLRRDTRAMISLGFIFFFIILPLIGPPIYQHIGGPYHSTLNGTLGPAVYHSPFHQELDRQDEGPSAQYWLGTDAIGRDLLARLMQGMLV
jgi:peptide/nickel transport system permease protein